jgi:hypothetical protein
MDNIWKETIVLGINEYMQNFNSKDPNISLQQIKSDLQKLIGIQPAIKLKWSEKKMINELKKSAGLNESEYTTIIDKVDEIDIYFLDNKNNPISLKYMF